LGPGSANPWGGGNRRWKVKGYQILGTEDPNFCKLRGGKRLKGGKFLGREKREGNNIKEGDRCFST